MEIFSRSANPWYEKGCPFNIVNEPLFSCGHCTAMSESGIVFVGDVFTGMYEKVIVGKTVNVGAGVVMLLSEDGCELIHPHVRQKIRTIITGKIL